MQKKQRRVVFILVGLLVAVGLVVIGAVVSVFAYRQFTDREERRLSLSLREGALIQDRLESEAGVLVLEVDAKGPAAAAGLRHGSIILKVEGVDVNNVQELRNAIGQHEAGETITLTVLSDEELEEIEVTLESAGPYLGATVGDEFGRFRGQRFGDVPELAPDSLPPRFPEGRGFSDVLPSIKGSIVVLHLESGGPAEAAGLEPGDILTELDGETIDNYGSFVEQVAGKTPGDTVVLTVRRGPDMLTISVTLAEHPEDPERGFLGINISPTTFYHDFFGEPGFRGDFFEDFSDQQRG